MYPNSSLSRQVRIPPTIALRVITDNEKETLFLRDLVLQVGGVSYETVKYSHEFYRTWTPRVIALARPRSNCTNYRPSFSSEGVSHIKKTTNVR
jgi:hypothetical protein